MAGWMGAVRAQWQYRDDTLYCVRDGPSSLLHRGTCTFVQHGGQPGQVAVADITAAPMQGDAKAHSFTPIWCYCSSSSTLSLHEWFQSARVDRIHPGWCPLNAVHIPGRVRVVRVILATLNTRREMRTSLHGTAASSTGHINCGQIARCEPLAVRTRQAWQGC